MAKRPLKVGLLIPSQTWGMDGETPHWPDILRMGQLAEQVGFDSLWLVDHLLARRGASGSARNPRRRATRYNR